MIDSPQPNQPASGDDAPPRLILVVEDEDAVRRLVRLILVRNGYRVLEAGHPEDAIVLVRKHIDEIDLVLTDVIMPGMSGRELFAAIAVEHPDMKVLYMTGYDADVVAGDGVPMSLTSVLQKPFGSQTMAAKVRAVLEQDNASPS